MDDSSDAGDGDVSVNDTNADGTDTRLKDGEDAGDSTSETSTGETIVSSDADSGADSIVIDEGAKDSGMIVDSVVDATSKDSAITDTSDAAETSSCKRKPAGTACVWDRDCCTGSCAATDCQYPSTPGLPIATCGTSCSWTHCEVLPCL